jgi:hypothetical protein
MDTPNNNINLQDLQNVLVVIDLACSRGAVRAAELTAVGQLYDKIQKFVSESTNAKPTQETPTNV